VSGENVVKILVTADDQASAGFGEVAGSADEMAEKVSAAADESAAAMEREADAQAELAEASARLAEFQSDSSASADELAGAQDAYAAALDRSTTATLGALDAQARLGAAELAASDNAKVAGDAQEDAGVKADASGGMFAGAGGKMKMAALGVAVGLGLAVKGAADFQQQTVRLVTSAGESAKNLGMVQRGILALSSSTNTSTSQLASGMYMVESAGFHGAAGLTVLKAAAQGAQAEGADLADVANAVTSGLNAYGMKANQATAFTDEMVRAVGQGKMTMQDLASSLSAVLPIAASAHISFAQVGGAVATMTMQGMSARQATQDLASSIRSLLNPNTVAVNEMNQFGISSVGVANKLGSRGLTGTISYLADTIAKQMGPSGDVILKTFNQSKVAAQDAETMLSAMPPKLKAMAQGYLDGTTSYQTWYTATKGLPPLLRNQADQFATVANSAHGFNSLLKSGQPDAQTFAAALGKMMGGATGLNTALMLTGAHTGQFNTNVKAIADSAKGAGSNVRGWSIIQGEANFQIGSAVKAIEAMGDSLGLALLPSVTAVLKPITSFFELIAKNKAAAIAFAAVLGTLLAGALGAKLASALSDAKAGLSTLFDVIGNAPSAISSMASGFASAAASVASFTVQTVKQLGEAMVATGAWIAEHAVAAASYIAENVAMAASATAAFIAENAATLGIVAGIALLVAGIVYLATHWRQVWDLIKHIFDDAVSFIKAHLSILAEIIGTILLGPVGFLVAYIATHWDTVKHLTADVVDFIKSHWQLLLAILTGPIGLAVLFIKDHWNQIRRDAAQAWDDVRNTITRAWDDIRHDVAAGVDKVLSLVKDLWNREVSGFRNLWHDTVQVVESLWHDVTSTFDRILQDVVSIVETLWHNEVSNWERIYHDTLTWVERLFHDVVSWFEQLPGKILSAIASLPGMLLRAGEHAIDSLIDGLSSGIGKIGSVMGGIASKIAGFIGLSPAREGPLSGSGAMYNRGLHIPQDVAAGIYAGLPGVATAAHRLAGTVALGGGTGGVGGGGGGLALDVRFSGTDSQIIKALWPHLKLEVRSLGGGGPFSTQKALGSTWPAGA
jgi:TP901 family phage tail tape measure protein